jgi:hypothetical protein
METGEHGISPCGYAAHARASFAGDKGAKRGRFVHEVWSLGLLECAGGAELVCCNTAFLAIRDQARRA